MAKDFVYVARNGNLTTEPADVFKQWMTKHDYDPEHGKSTPIQISSAATNQTGTVPPNSTHPTQGAPPQ